MPNKNVRRMGIDIANKKLSKMVAAAIDISNYKPRNVG